jgi:hypothetical protein
MPEHHRRWRSRTPGEKTKLLLRFTAVAVGILAVFLVLSGWLRGMRDSAMRQAVKAGQVSLEGVNVSFDPAQDTMTATLYLINTGERAIEGQLVVEFTPDPDRLAEAYLEAWVAKRSNGRDPDRLASELEGRPRLQAKERALLAYLKRGGRTDSPSFETIPYDVGARPNPLVFRKKTALVRLLPRELTRVLVTQNIPEARMGEEVTTANTRIVDLEP